MSRFLLPAFAILLVTSQWGTAATADYAIVVSQTTHDNDKWKNVVSALQQKYTDAPVLVWKNSLTEVLPTLKEKHPRYTCFVATAEEAGRQFVADVHCMTRRYDDDVYTDTIWGILTGYDAANALEIAKESKPLTVHNVGSGTEVALKMCSAGIWYDELVQHKSVSIHENRELNEWHCPADTTKKLAELLTSDKADLFVTSGHATERDWQIGFSYRNGQFRSKNGQMFGVTTTGERFGIQSKNPKVYLPIGNCLMGHIDGPDAMALAWMNNVGVRQMIGYTVVTWYGYAGWGVLDYFVEQPGRYSLSESFHANHHALIHRLDTCFNGIVTSKLTPGGRTIPSSQPNERGRAIGLTANDSRGLLWDRDTVAFYGDPAWNAHMKSRQKWYEQNLAVDGDTYTLTIIPQNGADSFKPVNTNGAQRGWRPIVELLDHRVRDVRIVEGQELNPVIADDFILVPNPRKADPAKVYQVRFTGSRID